MGISPFSSTWKARKMNRWVSHQILELGTCSGSKNDETGDFGCIVRRPNFLKKTIILLELEGSRKGERPNMRCIDCKGSHNFEFTGAEQG